MKLVITGSTGFIGSAVVRACLRAGLRPTLLMRAESDLHRLQQLDGVDIVRYSQLSDPGTVASLSAYRPDVFVHCAWRGVGGRDRNEAFQIPHNVPWTLDAVELAAQTGCKQWIGLGSQAEYGNANRRLDENTLERPTTLYGKAKLAAGIAGLGLCEAHGMIGTWLRVFSTYGPGDAPTWFIPYIAQELLNGRRPNLTPCEQRWDYLYVDDAAAAVIKAAQAGAGGVFNLGSGVAHSLREIVEEIRAAVGSTLEPNYGAIPYRPDQVMHLEADITRLTAGTGWRPATALSTGIRATVAFERTRKPTGSSS